MMHWLLQMCSATGHPACSAFAGAHELAQHQNITLDLVWIGVLGQARADVDAEGVGRRNRTAPRLLTYTVCQQAQSTDNALKGFELVQCAFLHIDVAANEAACRHASVHP